MSDRPVGEPVDATPAAHPGPVRLSGRFSTVEKLDAAKHGERLWRALQGRDELWTYMAHGPFADAASFTAWLKQRAALEDPYAYSILDAQDNALGLASLMSIRPEMRVIEVGFIVLSPALQRTPLASEAQYLLARYVFETLRYRRYEWKCDALNAASRRAASRLGFQFEGVFRQHMIVKGRNRDTAWFAMLDKDWPARRAAFEAWLEPDNFDAAGRQRAKLGA